MYYNDYEEYMRDVLGYNSIQPNIHKENYYASQMGMLNQLNQTTQQNQVNQMHSNFIPRNLNTNTFFKSNIEDLYPDIYKVVNPVISKICKKNTKPITEDVLEDMVTEVFNNVNIDDINIVNINIETKDTRKTSSKDIRENKENKDNRDDRRRRPNNQILRDLIKILILNQILSRNFTGMPLFSRNPQETISQNPYLNQGYNYMNF